MKHALSALAMTFAFTSFAQASNPESVPSRLTVVSVTCTAQIGGVTKPVVTSETTRKGLQIKFQNILIANQAPRYEMEYSVYNHTHLGYSVQIFAVGNPTVYEENDTRMNELYIEIDENQSRIGHGYKWLNLKGLKCDFDFAG